MTGVLGRYRAERLPVALVATVATLIALGAQLATSFTLPHLPGDLALAAWLFVTFRVLDDLTDREADRVRHPERVLSRAESIRPIAAALVVLAVGAAALLWLRGASRSIVVAAVGLFALIGAWSAGRGPRSLAGDHVLLAKYPAFVWIIAASRTGEGLDGASARLALALLATYMAAGVYEAVHDPASPAAAQPALVVGEAVLLAASLTALSMRGVA
jgi:4-hydroxybenzoate polyprenyltransferase